ncbi:hypothetical protein OKW34_003072 [Paraburkholderia youngii]
MGSVADRLASDAERGEGREGSRCGVDSDAGGTAPLGTNAGAASSIVTTVANADGACLTHARRTFVDALKGQKKPGGRVAQALKYFEALY